MNKNLDYTFKLNYQEQDLFVTLHLDDIQLHGSTVESYGWRVKDIRNSQDHRVKIDHPLFLAIEQEVENQTDEITEHIYEEIN